MMTRYSTKSEIKTGDRMICWSTDDGGRVEIPFSVLLEFMRDNLGSPDFVQVFAQPGGNNFTVPLLDSSQNQWLLLQPQGNYTPGAITMPSLANAIDGQEVIVTCNQQVNTFSINANGALEVVGAPTALSAGDNFRLKLSKLTNTWYVV